MSDSGTPGGATVTFKLMNLPISRGTPKVFKEALALGIAVYGEDFKGPIATLHVDSTCTVGFLSCSQKRLGLEMQINF